MFKKILATLAIAYAGVSFAAAVDVNKASAADLDSIKGIGPGISGKILEERKKAPFKDWQDFMDRVKGIGEGNAAKFSREGVTVNGQGYVGAPGKSAEKPKQENKPSKDKTTKEKTVETKGSDMKNEAGGKNGDAKGKP